MLRYRGQSGRGEGWGGRAGNDTVRHVQGGRGGADQAEEGLKNTSDSTTMKIRWCKVVEVGRTRGGTWQKGRMKSRGSRKTEEEFNQKIDEQKRHVCSLFHFCSSFHTGAARGVTADPEPKNEDRTTQRE